MNNRHLFRGKVLFGKKEGKWITGFYSWCEDNSFINVHEAHLVDAETNSWENYLVPYNVDSETVGQCTGLKDKNDVFIFEGDKLKLKFYTCVVVWDKCFSKFKMKDIKLNKSKGYNEYPLCEINVMDIAGNIHDEDKS